jgi:membrane fusion protein (multidrug efflux system)
VKAALKILGIIFALVLLGGVMAYLAGFFDEKIPIDFSRVVPAADSGRKFTVKVAKEPLFEQAAPIAGRIVERLGDPGDTAIQGEPLLRMYDPATLRLEANVRESVASKLTKDQHLTAEIDALKKKYSVVVDEIVPSADPGSRSFLVKVSLTDGAGLYPGMFGRLMIPIGKVEKIYIPIEAVTQVGQLDFVIVDTEQGAVRRYMRLGESGPDDRIEVISGLTSGETVLIASQ